MKTYQAFVLTFEGHVIGTVDLICATEDEAKGRAQQLVGNDPVEVWDGPRRIARFQPKRERPDPS